MKVSPILFSGPMVCALVEDRKSQTRRLLKPQPFLDASGNFCSYGKKKGSHVNWGQSMHGEPYTQHYIKACVRWQVGDLLWVKEAYALAPMSGGVRYYATDDVHELRKKKPSLFMPRIFSRLTLEVTEVRIQRLRDISEEDAEAEGCNKGLSSDDPNQAFTERMGGKPVPTYRIGYSKLWDDLNAKPGTGWYDNPWIVAVSFEVHKLNVDRFLKQRAAA
jgi:hypothetical protein